MDKITIKINGYQYIVSPDETILDICKRNNIFIPTFCHDERFTSDGSCRMCVVEVNGEKTLQTSCTLYPTKDMELNTLSDDVIIARREILKMIWSKHPGECVNCDSAGNCTLESYMYKYDIPKEKAYKIKTKIPDSTNNPYFDFDPGKCILCYKCLNICTTIDGEDAISISGDKNNPVITFNFNPNKEYLQCLTCGECADICPTGAITPKKQQ